MTNIIKYLKKFKIIFFIPLALFFVAFLSYSPAPAHAVNDSLPNWTMPDLQIDIGGLKNILKNSQPLQCGADQAGNQIYCINWIGEYIAGIYKYAIGIVGILAAVVLMIGGLLWIVAGGNATAIGEAKAWIGASLTGLVIALCSYVILYQVNPALTVFKPLQIAQVKKTDSAAPISGCRWTKYDAAASGPDANCSEAGINWEVKDSGCVGEKTTNSDVCCCPTLGGTWTYDPGIQAQAGDASVELLNLLGCLRSRLPNGVGRISSISDSNCIGNLSLCKSYPACPAGAPACRQHAQNSCHYGGSGSGNKSYAVDIGDETDKPAIQQALNQCNIVGTGGAIIDENNHLHISASQCSGN